MCLSSRDKPLSVFAYYVCFVQVLHVLSANRCTWGWQRKRHLLVNVHTNALWCFFFVFFLCIWRRSEHLKFRSLDEECLL